MSLMCLSSYISNLLPYCIGLHSKVEILKPGRFKFFKILKKVVFFFFSLHILHYVAKLAKHFVENQIFYMIL